MKEQANSYIGLMPLWEKAICSQGKIAALFCEEVSQETGNKKTAKNNGMYDKRTSLTEAVRRCLEDGITISIGGFANTRIPVASIHEIIRQGAQDLTISAQSNSICCELLAGAMILDPNRLSLRKIEISWNDNERIGASPLLRYLISNKMIQVEEYSASGMSARFKAGAMGVPFFPVADNDGSGRELVNRGRMTICPFTGEDVYLVPACKPDLALIHVQAVDMYGNGRIFGDHYVCPEIAEAAINTIITTEQIIQDTSIRKYPYLTAIPFHVVDAVVDQPFGATPGTCYGNYGFDEADFLEFIDICEDFCETGDKDNLRDYYNKYIFDIENFDDFLEQKPYPILQKLCQLDDSQAVFLD